MTTTVEQGKLSIAGDTPFNENVQQAVLQIAAQVTPPNSPPNVQQAILQIAVKRPTAAVLEVGPITPIWSSNAGNRTSDPYRIFLY